MDPRRLLILLIASPALTGCAALAQLGLKDAAPGTPSAAPAEGSTSPNTPAPEARAAQAVATFATMAPIANPPDRRRVAQVRPPAPLPPPIASARPDPTGPAAIAAANAQARERSQARSFLGGVQVFGYEPGRVYEVWTAPLRVTTLSLSVGETVVSKAAGDTVRWQIGETESGEGPTRRAHVMIKPLERGLETNLVLATNRRIYLVQLRSGAPDAFNAVVTWDVAGVLAGDGEPTVTGASSTPPGLVAAQGPLDAGYRIKAKGRRPAWTPSAVMTDGVRTFLTIPATVGETPALFAVGPDGATQQVNYRQQGGLWVVDRVLDAAELRLGGRKAQVVRIERIGAAS